jgi:hypothetical protein
MASKKKRIARNMGRIEFIASRDVIVSMSEQGFDNKKIHTALAKKKRLTMSYATFCYQMARFRKAENERQGHAVDHVDSSEMANATFTHPGSRQLSFSVNKTPSTSEMI